MLVFYMAMRTLSMVIRCQWSALLLVGLLGAFMLAAQLGGYDTWRMGVVGFQAMTAGVMFGRRAARRTSTLMDEDQALTEAGPQWPEGRHQAALDRRPIWLRRAGSGWARRTRCRAPYPLSVTRSTSSTVVRPLATFCRPSCRSVVIPRSTHRRRNSVACGLDAIVSRKQSSSTSNS